MRDIHNVPLVGFLRRFKDSTISIKNGEHYVIHENGTLEIHVAQPLNSGKYTCIATNNLGIRENHVFLEVKGQADLGAGGDNRPSFGIFTPSAPSPPPEPTRILKQPEYRVVQRGMSALFECKVKHDPSLTPTMTWLKDNGELPDHER